MNNIQMKELNETGSVRVYGSRQELNNLFTSLTLDEDLYSWGIIETNAGDCLEVVRYEDGL